MSFKRTGAGLENSFLFRGVDLTVYTEGGETPVFSKSDIIEGKGSAVSDDIRFWNRIFLKYKPNVKVKLIAVGSCTTLKEIADDIVENDLKNVAVAMDRDYQNFWATKIVHPAIVYTRTYSWENELLNSEVIFGAFQKVARDELEEQKARQSISKVVGDLVKNLKWFGIADIVCVAACSSFFPRNNAAGWPFKNSRKASPPTVDKDRLTDFLTQKRKDFGKLRLTRQITNYEVSRDVYGKPLLFAAVMLIRWLIACEKYPALANDYIIKFLLDSFSDWLDGNDNSEPAVHFRNEIEAIPVAG